MKDIEIGIRSKTRLNYQQNNIILSINELNFLISEIDFLRNEVIRTHPTKEDLDSDIHENNIIQLNELKIDIYSHQVWKEEQEIILTSKEYELLLLFVQHPKMILSKEIIFDSIWNRKLSEYEGNIIEVYIRYLRKKLGHIIYTVRGSGYILR